MSAIARDLRGAFRALGRNRGVSVLAVASLALAIGFSTAAFSVLDAYSLRELAVSEPKQLARITVQTREKRPDILSWPEYDALANRSRLTDGIIAENRRGPRVQLPDRDDFPITAGVSDNYFDVLGVRAAAGDVFHAAKGKDGIVVLSDRYAKKAFGGAAGVVGRSLPVGPAALTIIGILPPAFTGTQRGLAVDLFVPSQGWFGSVGMARANAVRFTDYEVLARLRPNATTEQARAGFKAIFRDLEHEGLEPAPDRKVVVSPFTEQNVTAKIQANAVFLGVMALLVLIAAANLANLRLVDNQRRRRETATRLALGAGPGDLARQHAAESLLLAVLGTAGGLLLAAWLIRIAPALFYGGQAYTDYGIRMDGRTFAFSSAALLAVALAGALIPLSDAWRQRIQPVLQSARTTGSSRWLAGLVVVQMALVTGVTCSAGLLWRSLQNVAAIRPAMNSDASVLMAEGFWADGDAATRTAGLADRLAGLPGVERVAWARRAMLSGSLGGATVAVEMAGQPKFAFRFNQVSPGYFETTGARVLGGRAFGAGDGPAATLVVMVNQTFARQFPNARPGEWIRVSGKDRQVVGIVEDGPTINLREPPQPYLYLPFAQAPVGELTFFAASRKDPGLLADSVRKAIRTSDRSFTVLRTPTMKQHLRDARSDEQLAAGITGGLALIGLLLAGGGLFGVTLFAVARRTPEFGIRVALGATPAVLARQILREAGLRVIVALPLGWALAYAGRAAIARMLYGVAADDPWTLAGASIVVALVAAGAALNPALRAARADPLTALRHD